MSLILTIAAFVMGMTGLCGCAGKAGPAAPPRMYVTIDSTTATNDGQPFYVVVRSCTAQDFITGSYASIAGMLFAEPSDPGLLAYREILPGYSRELIANRPEKEMVGIYCLFTNPEDQWKTLIPQPLADRYRILLGKDRILETNKVVRKRKGLFQRWFSSEPTKGGDSE